MGSIYYKVNSSKMTSRKVVQYSVALLAIVAIQIFLLDGSAESAPVKSRKSFRAAKKYLRQYGYLPKNFQKKNFTEEMFMSALKSLQNFSGLKATGQVDDETIEKIKQPRCGVPDLEDESKIEEEEDSSPGEREKRSTARRKITKWRKKQLTYRIWRGASGLDLSVTRDLIREAFQLWSQVTPLQFRETASWYADINIIFTTRNHYDSFPFDGKGRVLAHSYPPSAYPIGGDIHFDDAEGWGQRKKGHYVLNLLQVASHEIGHSLGLPHSKDKRDLMAPFYETTAKRPNLSKKDIRNIQILYGSPLLDTTDNKNTKKFLTNQL